MVTLQDQGHRINSFGILGNVFLQGILMWCIKDLVLTVQKSKVFKNRWNSKVKVTVKNGDTHSKVLSEDPNETFFWLRSSDLECDITHHLPSVLEGEPDPTREY